MSSPARGRPSSWAEFEAKVADLYRALGYQVTHNLQLPGKQTDVLARLGVPGAPPLTLAIECKAEARPIGNDAVLKFVARVVTHRAASEINAGVMVSQSGYTKDARAAVLNHPYVSLLTLEDLTAQLVDVRHQLRELVDAYEDSPIFRDYLPVKSERLSWDTLSPDASTSRDRGADSIEEWRSAARQRARTAPLLILADFGAGKTTLLHHMEYEYAGEFLAGHDTRIPLFVPLRLFRDYQDMTALLRAAFRDSFYRDLPPELLWQRIDSGSFYLLLDAFDEMAERSDSKRRLELFYELIPAIESRSPVVITSRPGYFATRGELNDLLNEIHLHATQSLAGSPGRATRGSVSADELLKKLIARHADRPRRLSYTALNVTSRDIGLSRLLPLDSDRIEELVSHRAEELATVGVTTEALMAFISRTHDLTDLATRPLLLSLIIATVIDGRIDVTHPSQTFGPSGLYELYVESKLTLDVERYKTAGGLKPDVRRRLAEVLAVAMYSADTLEMDFSKTVETLATADRSLQVELDASGLSQDEIATDFATSSFITLDDAGMCRFIHRSFRGFFVARALKRTPHALWNEPLEREVLYFVGGFAPTEPTLAEYLWTRFEHGDQRNVTLRRNFLMASLYTRQSHEGCRIVDAEIWDAGYGALSFVRPNWKRVVWRDSFVGSLSLDGGLAEDVVLDRAQIGEMHVRDAELTCDVNEAICGTLDLRDGVLALAGRALDCASLMTKATDVVLALEASRLHDVQCTDSTARFAGQRNTRLVIDQLGAMTSTVMLADVSMLQMHVAESLVVTSGAGASVEGLSLTASVVYWPSAGPRRPGSERSHALAGVTELQADEESVIVFADGVYLGQLDGLSCGVFGRLMSSDGLKGARSCWGVVDAGEWLSGLEIEADLAGLRRGRLLLMKSDLYAATIGAELLGRLEGLRDRFHTSYRATGRFATTHTENALHRVARDMYDTLTARTWREVRDGEERA